MRYFRLKFVALLFQPCFGKVFTQVLALVLDLLHLIYVLVIGYLDILLLGEQIYLILDSSVCS